MPASPPRGPRGATARPAGKGGSRPASASTVTQRRAEPGRARPGPEAVSTRLQAPSVQPALAKPRRPPAPSAPAAAPSSPQPAGRRWGLCWRRRPICTGKVRVRSAPLLSSSSSFPSCIAPSAGLQRSPEGSGPAAWLEARRGTKAAITGALAGLSPGCSSCRGLAASMCCGPPEWGSPALEAVGRSPGPGSGVSSGLSPVGAGTSVVARQEHGGLSAV